MFLVPDRRSLRRLGPDLALVLTGLPLTLLAVLVLVPLTAVSAVFAILWIGVLLLPLALTLASWFAGRDRGRLRRWGLEVSAPRYRPTGSGAAGLARRAADARRWLDLGFEGLIALPLRVLTASLTLAWALAALGGLTHWAWGRLLPPAVWEVPGQWALALVTGLVLLLSFPSGVHLLARIDAAVTASALGGAAPGSRMPGLDVAPGRGAPGPAASLPRLRESAWSRMTIAFLAFVLLVVGWPVITVVYEVHPAPAMLVTAAAGAAALLGARWPWAGLALSALAALATMLLTASGQAIAPWPWPVTALLAHCLSLAVLAIFHRWYWALSAWSAGATLTLAALLVTDPATMPDGTLRAVMTNGVVLWPSAAAWCSSASRCASGSSPAARRSRRRPSARRRCAAAWSSRSAAASPGSCTTWWRIRCRSSPCRRAPPRTASRVSTRRPRASSRTSPPPPARRSARCARC